ncbi:MAG: CPBP family intramembrane glutamic endopeptidase [Algibacter sp.]
MYIAQAFKGLHDWWRYLIGLVIVLIAWQVIGGIPFLVGLIVETLSNGGDIAELDQLTQNELLSILEPNLNLFLMLLMFVFGLIALFLVVKYMHKLSLTRFTTSRKKIDWKRFWFSFILWGILSSGILFIDYYLTPEDYVLNFKLVPFLILCVIAIIMIPLQTSFEEYLFRGYLIQGIGVIVKNKWAPLIITSLGFGLLHIANPEVDKLGPIIMVYYIGTGFFLGIITLMDEGLELALGFHAANNLFTALLVTADWTALQTHSVFKDMSDPETMKLAEIFVPVFVIFPILLFIYSKKYKWNNWSEKLFGDVKEGPEQDYKIID